MEDKQFKPNEEHNNALDVARDKTSRHAKQLWQLISGYGSIEGIVEQTESRNQQKKSNSSTSHSYTLLKLLQGVPYLLGAIFIISFLWDFNGVSAELWGWTLSFEGLLRILSVSGLIGFFTNWLAITMLFKPAEKRPILGHGLIPAQKERIAFKLAQTVSRDLINPKIIKQRIRDSNAISRYRTQSTSYLKNIIDDTKFRKDLKKWVVSYFDEMIADPEIRGALAERILLQLEQAVADKSFEKAALKAYSFVKGKEMQHIIEEALIQIPSSVESGLDKTDELLDQLPEQIDKHSDQIEDIVTSLLYKLVNQLDVHKLVEQELRNYDEQHLANIIRSATNEQLQYIQYLGGVLGVIGGFVIWQPLLSGVVLVVSAGTLLGVDHLLYQYEKN